MLVELDMEQMLETLIPPPAEIAQQCSAYCHWVIHFFLLLVLICSDYLSLEHLL